MQTSIVFKNKNKITKCFIVIFLLFMCFYEVRELPPFTSLLMGSSTLKSSITIVKRLVRFAALKWLNLKHWVAPDCLNKKSAFCSSELMDRWQQQNTKDLIEATCHQRSIFLFSISKNGPSPMGMFSNRFRSLQKFFYRIKTVGLSGIW